MLPGIDVSNHQGTVNWSAVANAGKLFAIIKATESASFKDPFFSANWHGAKENGLVRGAYHFARPSVNGPIEEADFFLNTIQDRVGDLEIGDLLVLDLEDPDVAAHADLGDWTLDFLRHVEGQVGFKPILYSGRFYLEPHGCTGRDDLAEYGLWLANFKGADVDESDLPGTPPNWPFIAIWQHSDQGQVPGVAGDCDLDLFNGSSIENLKKYGKLPEPVAEPEPV